MNKIDTIQHAIETGEILNIIYHGGSQPGTAREIAPIAIKDDKVRARCLTSNAVKAFIIDKIYFISGDSNSDLKDWAPDAQSLQKFESIEDLYHQKSEQLQELGWHIEQTDETLTLHRRFKNGKPLKGWDLEISYNEFTYDLVAGPNGEFLKENIRKRQRPWSVRATGKDTKSYSNIDKASLLFIDWASDMAPLI